MKTFIRKLRVLWSMLARVRMYEAVGMRVNGVFVLVATETEPLCLEAVSSALAAAAHAQDVHNGRTAPAGAALH